MRNFIVRHFALRHHAKIFGFKFNPARASTPTVIVFLTAVLSDKFDIMPLFHLSMIGLIICAIVGFFYFKVKPITWEDLDNDDQRYDYGLFKGNNMPIKQFKEWRDIKDDIEGELDLVMFRKIWPVLLPILYILLTALIFLLC